MKLKKLFKKADTFLSSEERSRKEKKKCVKHVLKKLRKFENEIELELENTTDDDKREHLQKKILLAHTQRKKGLKMLKELKKS